VGLGGSVGGERGPYLIGSAVGMTAVAAAGVLAIMLIRRIESRMAQVAPVAQPRPRIGQAIGGAVVGLLVGVGWWAIVVQPVFSPGISVLVYAAALVLGAAVGYFTLLGAGARGRNAAIVSGAAALLATVLADLVAFDSMAPLRFLADLVTNPGPALSFLGRELPLVLVAVAAGVAIALVKLPVDLWSIGAPKKARVRVVPTPVPVAPPAVAPMPMPMPAPTAAPTVAPAPVTAPMPVSAPQPAAVREPFDLGAFVKRNRVPLLVSLGVVVLAMIGIGVAGAFVLGRSLAPTPDSTPQEAPRSQSTPSEQAPAGDAVVAPPADATPAEVVLALYEAAAAQDEAAVRGTFAFGFDFDFGTLDAWGDPSYALETVTVGDRPSEMLVQVRETGGGFSDWDVVTWMLTEQDGRWRIRGWQLGEIGSQGSSPVPYTPGGAAGDPATAATNTTAVFLQARMQEDITTMRDIATDRLEAEHPELFSTGGPTLLSWNLQSVQQDGAAYVMWVEEMWDYSTIQEVHLYTVITAGDTSMVDDYQ